MNKRLANVVSLLFWNNIDQSFHRNIELHRYTVLTRKESFSLAIDENYIKYI